MFEFRNYCCAMLVTNAKRERFPKHFSVKFFFHKSRNQVFFVVFRRKKSNDAVNYNLGDLYPPLPGCNILNEFDIFKYPCPSPPLLQINGRQFPAEAFYQRHVHHPNIIELLDVFTHEDNFVFVLERPEKSSDLFDYIDERDYLAEDEGRRFFTNILDAAIQCEGYGVLHQDIKPENIIIDLSKMEAKLTDFGLANDIQVEPIRHFVGKGCTTDENAFLCH